MEGRELEREGGTGVAAWNQLPSASLYHSVGAVGDMPGVRSSSHLRYLHDVGWGQG